MSSLILVLVMFKTDSNRDNTVNNLDLDSMNLRQSRRNRYFIRILFMESLKTSVNVFNL